MNMAASDAEDLILRALIQDGPEGGLRAKARSLLAAYRWQDPVHEEVFRTLIAMPAEGPVSLRNQIAARVTRRGFPDFDLEKLFQPPGLSPNKLADLMNLLARMH